MEDIAKTVADFYNIYYPVLMIKGRSTQKQAIAKQMAMLLVKEYYPKITLEKIGTFFNRHHSTIIHGINSTRNEMEVSKKRSAEYDKIKEKLNIKLSVCAPVEFKISNNSICPPSEFKIPGRNKGKAA